MNPLQCTPPNVDRHELADKIRTIGGLSDDERAVVIELLKRNKKYGLVWEEKPEAVEERLAEELPVLTEVAERAIVSPDADAPNHILIEGDNLEALTTLAYTHEGKIDVIYIDPPYNTGNKDFVYNDHYVDADDAYRHSTWLSFMHRRLKIAKRLLSVGGVIFISIDDNEQAQLKLLCDEVFGQDNFIDIFSWVKTMTPANLSKKTKKAVEYILAYTKTKTDIKFQGLKKNSISNNGLMNQTNAIHDLVFPANIIDTKLADGWYKKGIYGTKNYEIELLEDTLVSNGIFATPVHLRGRFKWQQNYLDLELSKGTKVSIKTKAFSPSYEKKEYDPEVPWNLINDGFGVDTNEIASLQLKEILSANLFDFPKPVSLIKYLINFLNAEFILDFFAGSGTTLHATMQLNAEDGGHRKCILVTNNENRICEEVTYERNRRVIQGYTTPKGEAVEGLKGNTLRYYRTDFVPRQSTFRNMRLLVNKATDMLCIKENLYAEQPTFGKFKTQKGVFRHFAEDPRHMLVIYREEAIAELVEEIYAMEVQEPIKVYLFSPSDDPWEGSFEEVADKVQLCALPHAILNAYRRVLPKPKEPHTASHAENAPNSYTLFNTIDTPTINEETK